MGRLGIVMGKLSRLVETLQHYPGLGPEGIYSHLATADEPDDEHARSQIQNFSYVQKAFLESGLQVPMWHLANSGGLLNYEDIYFDMVRPGISSYGYYPSKAARLKAQKESIKLRPVMELKSRVSSHKTLPPGHGVSYGKTFVTQTESQMSVVPLGYGDGFPRILSNDWPVLFAGQLYPIRGRVSMDQIVIESGSTGPKVGDVVTILGGDERHSLWADVWADKLDTIPYEILCGFSARVPMIYYSQ
jgi:alanine racemase